MTATTAVETLALRLDFVVCWVVVGSQRMMVKTVVMEIESLPSADLMRMIKGVEEHFHLDCSCPVYKTGEVGLALLESHPMIYQWTRTARQRMKRIRNFSPGEMASFGVVENWAMWQTPEDVDFCGVNQLTQCPMMKMRNASLKPGIDGSVVVES